MWNNADEYTSYFGKNGILCNILTRSSGKYADVHNRAFLDEMKRGVKEQKRVERYRNR